MCTYIHIYIYTYRQIVSRQTRECCWLVRSAGLFGPAAGADTLEPFDEVREGGVSSQEVSIT